MPNKPAKPASKITQKHHYSSVKRPEMPRRRTLSIRTAEALQNLITASDHTLTVMSHHMRQAQIIVESHPSSGLIRKAENDLRLAIDLAKEALR